MANTDSTFTDDELDAIAVMHAVGALPKGLLFDLVTKFRRLRPRWSPTPPTEPGWYWHRIQGSEAEMIRLLGNITVDGLGGTTPKECGGEWAGPLESPA